MKPPFDLLTEFVDDGVPTYTLRCPSGHVVESWVRTNRFCRECDRLEKMGRTKKRK